MYTLTDSTHHFQILATGLSGLYSALPRRLGPWCESSPGWHRISADDLREMPELALFLSSLQFCDAVLQVSSLLLLSPLPVSYVMLILKSFFNITIHKTSTKSC